MLPNPHFSYDFRHLINKVEYIDAERVGVWGHGYGAHLATRILAEDKDREIRCAIAVAPIVKWQIHGKLFQFEKPVQRQRNGDIL